MKKIKNFLICTSLLCVMACSTPTSTSIDDDRDKELREQALSLFKPLKKDTAAQGELAAKIALGRTLFFDKRISAGGEMGCAQCHQPEFYGASGAVPSQAGSTLQYNIPTVLNASLNSTNNWYGDQTSIENQSLASLESKAGLGHSSKAKAVAKIKTIPEYAPLFAAAFPDKTNPVTPKNLAAALGAYQRTLITPAPLDEYLDGNDKAISAEAKIGLKRFMDIGCVERELLKALKAAGKKVIFINCSGSAMGLTPEADICDAILQAWYPGEAGGLAVADVLFGDYNPSGKLPISFPRDEGQIPIYYNHFNTGRPAQNEMNTNYVSAYTDLPNSPKFPFGFGLSYTTFQYSDLKLSKQKMKSNELIEVSLTIKNTGKFAGEEVVQLYLRDKAGSVVRPILELKDFQKLNLEVGESKIIKFIVDNQKLSFYNSKLEFSSEPGDFDIMIGSSSADIRLKGSFELVK